MQQLTYTLNPQGDFITPLRGDTLFGQICWQIAQTQGEEQLAALLQGYQSNNPFLIVADPIPQGHIPNPAAPIALKTQNTQLENFKALKKLAYLPQELLSLPLNQWLDQALTTDQRWQTTHLRIHNALNRLTNSTGEGFAPFTLVKRRYQVEDKNHPHKSQQTQLSVVILYDEQRISADTITQLLTGIGQFGYGRKATTGHGKFTIERQQQQQQAKHPQANAYLTLAPSQPPSGQWNLEQSYYLPHTRFGRHGSHLVHLNPFKKPLVLCDTGALLTPSTYNPNTQWVGQGIGNISLAQPNSVHQGYAPVLHIKV